jgi:hypothetical protein
MSSKAYTLFEFSYLTRVQLISFRLFSHHYVYYVTKENHYVHKEDLAGTKCW